MDKGLYLDQIAIIPDYHHQINNTNTNLDKNNSCVITMNGYPARKISEVRKMIEYIELNLSRGS